MCNLGGAPPPEPARPSLKTNFRGRKNRSCAARRGFIIYRPKRRPERASIPLTESFIHCQSDPCLTHQQAYIIRCRSAPNADGQMVVS
jgi:hypothetical protein